ncbi:hypothetical protein KY348_06030 [Candidatus Woesearchaeota archaeon]|nr:hypothetical protein [Candidatus Woesearchaeota archaeon]
MKKAQEIVAKFNQERGWDKDITYLKDFLLNICEETGEVWNHIKWINVEKQKKVIEEHKDEWIDFIGDELFLVLKIAYLLDIDAQEAFEKTMADYEKRFPAEKIRKLKHGNPLAGGMDDKQKTE